MQLLTPQAFVSAILCVLLATLCPEALALPSGSDTAPTDAYPSRSTDFQKPSEYRRAKRLLKDDNYAEAIQLLLLADKKSPNDPDILNELGFGYRQAGQLELGLGYYTRALKLNPDHKEAHEYLGELYLKQHRLAKAQEQLKELSRICPDGCEARTALERAIAAYQSGE